MKYLFLIFSLLLGCVSLLAQEYTPVSNDETICHTYYSLGYSEEHEQAAWVYYHLTPPMVSGAASRSDNFRPDPKVSTLSAVLSDYVGSGYDRGHLCPAASMSLNAESMSESFFMSNMSPQEPSFNRGRWKQLEELVRSWVVDSIGIHVVSGPIFKDNRGSIGGNEVTVPGYYYKAIYSPVQDQMIGFIMPNEKLSAPLISYVATIDAIEELTHIDLFSQLESEYQAALESTTTLAKWSFDGKTTSSATQPKVTSEVSSPSSSGVCRGRTKSGSACKNKTSNPNGYCHLHQSQADGM